MDYHLPHTFISIKIFKLSSFDLGQLLFCWSNFNKKLSILTRWFIYWGCNWWHDSEDHYMLRNDTVWPFGLYIKSIITLHIIIFHQVCQPLLRAAAREGWTYNILLIIIISLNIDSKLCRSDLQFQTIQFRLINQVNILLSDRKKTEKCLKWIFLSIRSVWMNMEM